MSGLLDVLKATFCGARGECAFLDGPSADGVCCCRKKRERFWRSFHLADRRPEQCVLVELIRAVNIPSPDLRPSRDEAKEGARPLLVDTDNRCDVYVELAVVREVGLDEDHTEVEDAFVPIAPLQRSELIWNCLDPVWHHWARFVGVDVNDAELQLLCRIVDHNQFTRDETIGSVRMPLRDLAAASAAGQAELPVKLRGPAAAAEGAQSCKLFLRCFQSRPQEKRLFLIRHAQSKWNQAQERHNLVGLAAFDHPLSPEGVRQAQGLRHRWRKRLEEGGGELEDWEAEAQRAFFAACSIFSSPLTRAVQTTFVALQGHPGLSHGPLRLLACAREVKGVAGLDAVGSAKGGYIERHVREALVTALGEEDGAAVMGPLDPYSCEHEWWTRYSDSRQSVEDRVTQLMNVVFSVPDESCIVTGHSLLFKRLFKGRAAECFAAERPQFVERLGRIKLDNAACIMVVVRPNEVSGEAEIVDAKLMFGSLLEDGLGEDGEAPLPARAA